MTSSSSSTKTTGGTSRPSSFLDSFLSDAPDPAPHASAPEDAKISDRSAFDKQNLSIQDIVSGLGVSSIANFPASQPAPPSRVRPAMYPTRESAIPTTPPKNFKGHRLSSFPDKPQRAATTSSRTSLPKRRQIQPINYTTGTFAAFRTMSSYTQHWRSISTTSAVYRQPDETFPTRKPTQMSPAELNKNPRFRSMSRQYTKLVVGIPFLIVSTYLLYQRADMFDKEAKVLSEAEAAAKEPRIKGVLPSNHVGRIDRQ